VRKINEGKISKQSSPRTGVQADLEMGRGKRKGWALGFTPVREKSILETRMGRNGA